MKQAVILILSFISYASLAAAPRLSWEVEGLETPESAYYDPQSKLIFVSQIVGNALDKDQRGYISSYDVSGALVDKEVVKGLNAPKGMRVHKGILWVSDIDQVLAINLKNKKIIKKISIPGSQFLNDVVVAPNGVVFVSDLTAGKIFTIKGNKAKLFASSQDLPNGLLIEKGKLLMVSWGEGLKDDFSTKSLGKMYTYDLKNKKRKALFSSPLGNLDGLEALAEGKGYLISDWVNGAVYKISLKGEVEKILALNKGAADIGLVPEKNMLLVPRMLENKLSAYIID